MLRSGYLSPLPAEMVDRPQDYRSRVSAIRWLAPPVVEADLELLDPPPLVFQAGQWISIPLGGKTVRAYTIASPPSQDHVLTLCVDVGPEGPGSKWFKALRVGQEVSFKAPNGDFVLRKGSGLAPIFVAEEIGIVPFRSMLLDLFERPVPRDVLLLFGAARRELLVYDQEFGAMAARHPKFRYLSTLDEPLWELVDRTVASTEGKEAYLCGGGTMIARVREWLMAHGMERRLIKREKFW